MPRPIDSNAHRTAFTLIELLIVVAIIAVLIAILIPGLGRARELARITKCSANQRTLAQAVQFFAGEHQGYGQLIALWDSWKLVGKHPERYVYEKPPWPVASIYGGMANFVVAPWPIAYAGYLGAPGLKSEDLLDPSLNVLLTSQRVIPGRRGVSPGRIERVLKATVAVLQCPSDRDLVGLLSPPGVYGRMSYSINTDLFSHGWATERDQRRKSEEAPLWRDGKPHNGLAIEGRLDRIVRPAEVLMFADGGGYGRKGGPGSQWVATLTFNSALGPTWSDFASNNVGSTHVPAHRHSAAGGLVGAFADGHASYLSPVQRGRVIRYSPNPRVTPYEP